MLMDYCGSALSQEIVNAQGSFGPKSLAEVLAQGPEAVRPNKKRKVEEDLGTKKNDSKIIQSYSVIKDHFHYNFRC